MQIAEYKFAHEKSNNILPTKYNDEVIQIFTPHQINATKHPKLNGESVYIFAFENIKNNIKIKG